MSRRIVASLIVCVALLTQIGASFWAVAAARDGMALCDRPVAASAMPTPGQDGAGDPPASAPAPHDHASCSLCQLGFSAVASQSPIFETRPVVFYARISRGESEAPAPRVILNRSAPARAPPSPV